MILRRKCIQQFLLPEEQIFTLPCYPRMGTPNFTLPAFPPNPNGAVSRFASLLARLELCLHS